MHAEALDRRAPRGEGEGRPPAAGSASAPEAPTRAVPSGSAEAEAAKPSPDVQRAEASLKGSVTQWGITWTFAGPARAGRFVTGDWWVVGPVMVTSIDPAPGPGRRPV